LSAPEAHLLINLPRWNARQALKLGFIGLAAQGILRVRAGSTASTRLLGCQPRR
jgi:hypothetical protein